MISFEKRSDFCFLTNGDFEAHAFCIFIGRIGKEASLGADNRVATHIGGSEAAGKYGQPLLGKAHGHRDHFFHFRESSFALAFSQSRDFNGFGAEQIAGRIDAVDAHVVERPSSTMRRFVDTCIAVGDLLREFRVEELRLANLAAVGELNCFKIAGLEMKAVSNHQPGAILMRGVDHGVAILGARCHGLFTENVNSGRGCANGIFSMQMIRQGDVDGVNVRECTAIVIVRIEMIDLVFLAQGAKFGGIIRNESEQLRVAGSLESRQNCDLCDVTQTYNSIANAISGGTFLHGFLSGKPQMITPRLRDPLHAQRRN